MASPASDDAQGRPDCIGLTRRLVDTVSAQGGYVFENGKIYNFLVDFLLMKIAWPTGCRVAMRHMILDRRPADSRWQR
eukprot:16442931-Heterocapsa_arctica.AAC.1